MVTNKLIYPKLSYSLVGILFDTHNELGNHAREKQYGNSIEEKLKNAKIPFKRELEIAKSGNIVDFLIDDKVILEIKAKRVITKSDYYQTQRYLQESRIRLALLVNFRNKYIKPLRIIRIDSKN